MKFLKRWIRTHGTPKRLITDNGRQYTGNLLKTFCRESRIRHTLVSRLNLQSNSCVELLNKTISNCLRIEKGGTIREIKKKLLASFNETYNKSTGFSPHELKYRQSTIDLFQRTLGIDLPRIKGQQEKASEERHRKENQKRVRLNLKLVKRFWYVNPK